MFVRAIRAHYVGGQIQPIGAVYEIGDALARELFTAGRVEMVTAPVPVPPADPVPPPPKRRRASEPVPDPLPLKIEDEVIDP
jgi:hypothetical protein